MHELVGLRHLFQVGFDEGFQGPVAVSGLFGPAAVPDLLDLLDRPRCEILFGFLQGPWGAIFVKFQCFLFQVVATRRQILFEMDLLRDLLVHGRQLPFEGGFQVFEFLIEVVLFFLSKFLFEFRQPAA